MVVKIRQKHRPLKSYAASGHKIKLRDTSKVPRCYVATDSQKHKR